MPKSGLRVKFCENVARYSRATKRGHVLQEASPAGWYIQVKICGKYHSLMQLRFARERDAVMAAQSLIADGLDTHAKLSAADGMTVMQVAVERLQW